MRKMVLDYVENHKEGTIYRVKDLDGLSVLRLNKLQLDDLVARIQGRVEGTPEESEAFRNLESCLRIGNMEVIEIQTN